MAPEDPEEKEQAQVERGESHELRRSRESLLRGKLCRRRWKVRKRRRKREEDTLRSRERPPTRRRGRERQAKKPAMFLEERGLYRYESGQGKEFKLLEGRKEKCWEEEGNVWDTNQP
ncbi:hypothetical protein NDU88_001314 [Pleurodeles waltl]|uniref:Uncharacterized protein n=1 Tax=Pleurodeles waltl TaxID=8319 RepID=A0AAV7UWG9_PLEWA|nr:hypothetical protein NDU88_001314 [Pleurodeles waltl]